MLVRVLLLARPRILKPHLRHTLTQSCIRCDPLQILAVGIVVHIEAARQHLQLLLGESGADAFALLLGAAGAAAADTVVARARLDLHRFHVVLTAQDLLAEHRKLFARRQLAIACVAREARQMVDGVFGLAHPIAGADLATASGAPGHASSAHVLVGYVLNIDALIPPLIVIVFVSVCFTYLK